MALRVSLTNGSSESFNDYLGCTNCFEPIPLRVYECKKCGHIQKKAFLGRMYKPTANRGHGGELDVLNGTRVVGHFPKGTWSTYRET